MKPRPGHQRSDLEQIARQAMRDRGLWPDFSPEAKRQVAALSSAATAPSPALRDLTGLLWCSIDNDDSLDLDQLSVAQELGKTATKILVAVADVDALVASGSAVDQHARNNTTSVYTGACIFPMLPERLSTDLTSLKANEDREALIIEMTVADGEISSSTVYRGLVRNHAKLAYNSVGAWIEGKGPLPEAAAAVPGMDRQLRLQDAVAQQLHRVRHDNGALDLETIEPRAVFEGETIKDLEAETRNRAKDLIEDFMIAANGVTARFLEAKGYPSLRRVVRAPERWQRIVAVAAEHGARLPAEPDSKALEEFLLRQRELDPLRFPDLSLVIVKLMGSGEYVVEIPGRETPGHFGLAVRDYTHSTAPNRRFPDLITHRILKAALASKPSPYDVGELDSLATHCTSREDDANRIERQVRKSAAALLLEDRIGQRFDAVVTGASVKGTFVRVLHPPVEGKVVHGFDGLEVGDPVRVKLIATDVERGFIDFVAIGRP